MAAYSALTSLSQTLSRLVGDAIDIPPKVKLQTSTTEQHVKSLLNFLENYPDKASTDLEGRMRDLANQAENGIEFFLARLWKSKSAWSIVSEHFPLNDLQQVCNEFDSLVQQVTKIQNTLQHRESQLHDSSLAPTATSSRFLPSISNDVMIGFEGYLNEIVEDQLCSGSSKLQVIPIHGMGGIGKTTLAQNAYHHPDTVQHFDIRAWITVSQEYNMQEILLSLLHYIKPSREIKQSDQNIGEMKTIAYQTLKGRRYLIVIDDIWSTDAWDDMKSIFSNEDNEGSRIILTTRELDVATYPIRPHQSPHKMLFLNADQSWDLLRHKIFGQEKVPSEELEAVGKKIARSCKGLPLGVVVIAGILSTVDRTVDSWVTIADKMNHGGVTNMELFADSLLSLSYNHLPQHLRPCFLYLGLFPEDYEIYTWKLFRMWEAEGFVKPIEPGSCIEEAEDYLEDLVRRNLVLVIKRKSDGKIKSCGLHDLLRNLCTKKAEEDKFLLHIKNHVVAGMHNQRRICFSYSKMRTLGYDESLSVHTIICFHCLGPRGSLDWLWRYSELVRVLDLLGLNSDELFSNEQFHYFHMRYLASDYFSSYFTSRISNFWNLQTLILHQGKSFKIFGSIIAHLPAEIWRLSQLRHLVAFVFGQLPHPDGFSCPLQYLQTISEVRNFECTEAILRMIPNLKKLGVSYSRQREEKELGGEEYEKRVKHEERQDYGLRLIDHLNQLEKFKFIIHHDFPRRERLDPSFPLTLKKLTLSGWRRPWNDMAVVASLPVLQVLKLRDFAFQGAEWDMSEVEYVFKSLIFLLIDKTNLQKWTVESSKFPLLESIVLYRCWSLRAIPEGFMDLAALELIELDDDNKALVNSAKHMQKELKEDWGNDTLRVRNGRYNMLTGRID